MAAQLKKLLAIGAIIGVGYLAFNRFSTEKIQNVQILSLEKTRKILQQIKHQTLIVTVTFAEGIKQKMANAMKGSKEDEKNELVQYFRTKMTEIYQQKQNLILNKYNVTKLQYQESLIKHGADPQVKKIQNVIIQAMERSINGQYPDLTVDIQASNIFGKVQLQKMYEEISKAILFALTMKLRDEKKKNPQFDSNDNDQFKKAVRELNVFDKKAQFLRKNGFKEEWGDFNEVIIDQSKVFFKLLQTEKMKDPKFKERMKAMEQIYDEAVEKISQNPVQFKTETINQMFAKKSNDAEKAHFLSKSMDYQKAEEQNIKLSRSTLPQYKEKQNMQNDVPDEANA